MSSIFDTNGKLLNQNLARSVYERVWDVLDKAAASSKCDGGEMKPTATMMDYFRDSLPDLRLDSEYTRLMLLVVEMWGAFIGDDCEHQGLVNLWLDEGLDGGKFSRGCV